MQEYVALSLFELSTNDNILYEENISLIKALNIDEAKKLIEKYSIELEDTYNNVEQEKVSKKFIKIIDINEVLYYDFENNIRDIYSRHFKDLESYKKFENLIEGEKK